MKFWSKESREKMRQVALKRFADGTMKGFKSGDLNPAKRLSQRLSTKLRLTGKAFRTGVKVSKKTKKRLRDSHLGQTGNLAGNWKGGITPENRKFRTHPRNEKWRMRVFKRDDFTCQKCNQKGVYLNAHHIKPFALFPGLRFRMDNGLTLCKECHKNTHKEERKRRKYESPKTRKN